MSSYSFIKTDSVGGPVGNFGRDWLTIPDTSEGNSSSSLQDGWASETLCHPEGTTKTEFQVPRLPADFITNKSANYFSIKEIYLTVKSYMKVPGIYEQ